jgi:hypothetical protein
MKTQKDIEKALLKCSVAMKDDDPKMCPLWPQDEDLYCHDCTARYAFRFVLDKPVDGD